MGMGKHIVMIGAGHTHALVIRRVSEVARRHGAKITLISGESEVPYSGMLPGVIAGIYKQRMIMIDVKKLAKEHDVAFIHENAVSIDLSLRQVVLESGNSVSFDYLSLNVGGDCTGVISEEGGNVMPIKPVAPFLDWLDKWQDLKSATCAVVGGGVAGVEVALVLDSRLRARGRLGGVYVVGRNRELVPAMPILAKVLRKKLVKRGISTLQGVEAVSAMPGVLRLSDGSEHLADYVIVCTGVRTWKGLAESGLEVDDRGCVVVNRWLRSVSHPDVFACGDCASWYRHSIPKSGVFAVRQASSLARNLSACISGTKLRSWNTSRNFLQIVNLGNGNAIAYDGGMVLQGRLVWRWKDNLDRRFMRKFA